MTIAVASARKSLGEFKPLIVLGNKTEVCESSPERCDRYTERGVIKGSRYARGTTYQTRGEAIAAAQLVIDARLADARERLARFSTMNNPQRDRGIAIVRNEIIMWGGGETA